MTNAQWRSIILPVQVLSNHVTIHEHRNPVVVRVAGVRIKHFDTEWKKAEIGPGTILSI